MVPFNETNLTLKNKKNSKIRFFLSLKKTIEKQDFKLSLLVTILIVLQEDLTISFRVLGYKSTSKKEKEKKHDQIYSKNNYLNNNLEFIDSYNA